MHSIIETLGCPWDFKANIFEGGGFLGVVKKSCGAPEVVFHCILITEDFTTQKCPLPRCASLSWLLRLSLLIPYSFELTLFCNQTWLWQSHLIDSFCCLQGNFMETLIPPSLGPPALRSNKILCKVSESLILLS
jgi:hypothetical protein